MRPYSRADLLAAFVLAIGITRQGLAGEIYREVPVRVDPGRQRPVDDRTFIFWRFEKEAAADETLWANLGELRGGAKSGAAPGRFGRALALSGGADGVFIPRIQGLKKAMNGGGATFEFWMRIEEYPDAPQCLLHLASSTDEPTARIDLLAGGKVRLRGASLPEAISETPLPVRAWNHLALTGFYRYQENHIFVDASGAAVLLDGRPFVVALAENTYYAFPPSCFVEALSLGNGLEFRSGFKGLIDEFRLTNGILPFYEKVEQPWVAARRSMPLVRPAESFRDPQALGFCQSFDAFQPESITAGESLPDARDPISAAALAEGLDLENPAEEAGHTEEEAASTAGRVQPPEALHVPQEKKVEPCPGVKGDAISIIGRTLNLPFPPGADFSLAGGTIEFWFKPGDWDNFTLRPGSNSKLQYKNTRLHLLTLYGRPREGDGEPQPLVRLYADRLRPEFEFPFPLMPYRWTHVTLIWGKAVQNYQPNLYLDAQWVTYGSRAGVCSRATDDVLEKFAPAFFVLGNDRETSFDELRLYSYPFIAQEVGNAHAEYTNGKLKTLQPAECSFDYRYSLGQLRAGIQALLADNSAVASAKVSLNLPHENHTIEASISSWTEGNGTAEFQVGQLPEGDYPFQGRLLDKNGRDLASFQGSFRRMPVPWLGNRLGLSDAPPPPFQPVTVLDNRVTAVGRQYTVSPSGLFTSISVLGEEILAAPIRFRLVSDGQEGTFSSAEPVRFGPCAPTETSWEGLMEAPGLSLRIQVRFEYDGMARYELNIRPLGEKVATVDRLSLLIPLLPEHAEFFHALPVGGNLRGYETAGYIPPGHGVVWDSRRIGKRPLGNFIPMVWLGGLLRGLCWFADNDQGWVPLDAEPAITIAREREAVTLGLHFISAPIRLEAPRRIVFGLVATPPKPLPADYRQWNRGRQDRVGPIGGRLTSCEAFAPWVTPPKQSAFDYWPRNYDWAFAERAAQTQRKAHTGKYPQGGALVLYHDRRWTPAPQDSGYFSWEWASGSDGVSYPPSKIDCLVWYMNEWIRRGIIDGIYIDDIFPMPDDNPITGSAYLLPDGRIQPGSAIFAYREYLKRLYGLFASYGKPPIITTHMTSTLAIPFHAFATVIFDGEDSGRFMGDDSVTFIDAWPLDRLLTLDNAERTGLVTAFMFKGLYASRGRPDSDWPHLVYRMYRSAFAIWMLFDMNSERAGLNIPSIVEAYDAPGVQVCPFWRNGKFVTIKPLLPKVVTDDNLLPNKGFWRHAGLRQSIGLEPLRATLYLKSDRALLVVVNFLRQPVRGRVRLDLAGIGVPAERLGHIEVEDVDTWPPPPGEDIRDLMKSQPKPEVPGEEGEGAEDDIKDFERSEEDGLRLRDAALVLEVRPHDFRLIELRW